MNVYRFESKLDFLKDTFFGLNLHLVLWKNLIVKFFGKLSFSSGSFVGSSKVYSVRLVLLSGLVKLFWSLGYVKSN